MPQEGKDPNEGLADDATLATDIKDAEAREAEQLEYYGGDGLDDDEDLSALDRGDSLEDESKDDDRGDEVDDDGKEEKDDESESEDDEAGDEEESADDDSEDDDAEADSEEGDDSGEESDDSDGDEAESDDSDGDESDAEKAERGIPRHRFNEVNERMKRAEKRLEELENTDKAKEDAKVEKYDFDSKEVEYMELLLDGKTSEAASLRREIREAEKQEFKAEAKSETVTEVSATQMQDTVDNLASQAENMYPILDEGHADYNPAVVNKVMTFMDGYQARGMSADDALVAGLADAVQLFDLDTKYGETESEDTKDEDTKPKVKKKAPIKKTKEKLKLQEKQGKSPAGEGKGSADAGAVIPDIEQMSDEEIDALPATTLARIRGDYVD